MLYEQAPAKVHRAIIILSAMFNHHILHNFICRNLKYYKRYFYNIAHQVLIEQISNQPLNQTKDKPLLCKSRQLSDGQLHGGKHMVGGSDSSSRCCQQWRRNIESQHGCGSSSVLSMQLAQKIYSRLPGILQFLLFLLCVE